MKNTFKTNTNSVNIIKEEVLSYPGNSNIDDEIRYMTDLKYLIDTKVKELNQESKFIFKE